MARNKPDETSASTKGSEVAEKSLLRTYYSLVKPGVLYGNVLTGVAGFLLAAGYFGRFNVGLFLAAIGGMTLVIGAACALNNVLDRDIDARMERTRTRAVVSGAVSPRSGTWFAAVLLALGLAVLALWTNWTVFVIGVFGFVVYVWLYGAFGKRRSAHGTIAGSISGAMPILAGYEAVADRYDAAALLLFLMLFFWQFPEFYSIAIYRRKEYKAAKIPVMSLAVGVRNTKLQIFAYTVAFVLCAMLLTAFRYTGWVYFGFMVVLGLYWLNIAVQGLQSAPKDDDAWARRMFRGSMFVILGLCVALSVGALLP